METAFVLIIVLICAILLAKKAYGQLKGGKCGCGCDSCPESVCCSSKK